MSSCRLFETGSETLGRPLILSDVRGGPSALTIATLKVAHCVGHDTVYDVQGIDTQLIIDFMNVGGKRMEWLGDKLISTAGSEMKDGVSVWLSDYGALLRWCGWRFLRTTHVVGGDGHWYIPSNSVYFAPHRTRTTEEMRHPQLGRSLRHIVVEVEWASLVDAENKGFSKLESLFALERNGTHIEEAWAVSVPDDMATLTATPLHALPQELHLPIEPVQERPPPSVLFLAVLTRTVLDHEHGHVRGYFKLECNRTFKVPAYSLLAAGGPAGGAGAPDLAVKDLLLLMNFTFQG
jgi:hypothetical protein